MISCRPGGVASIVSSERYTSKRQKDQSPLAKSKTTTTKSRTSSGKSAGKGSRAAGGAAKKTAKKAARKSGSAKGSKSAAARGKSGSKSGNKSGNKAGNKQSIRALAKATVKAKTPVANSATKPATKSAAKPKAPESKWLKLILGSLNEMKAEDTVVIDLSDKSSIGETMVVTTGRSNVHLQAIADRVIKDLKAEGLKGIAVEGLRQGDWVVIDTGSVLVHVFRPEVRAFYGIENMWSA